MFCKKAGNHPTKPHWHTLIPHRYIYIPVQPACKGILLGFITCYNSRPVLTEKRQSRRQCGQGASVIYQCLNAPYNQWPERFPPLQRGVLAAAERTGALLVTLENLYGYGPTGGRPMTEDLPLAATSVKGRTRAAMTGELLAAAEPAGSVSPSGGPRTFRSRRHRRVNARRAGLRQRAGRPARRLHRQP